MRFLQMLGCALAIATFPLAGSAQTPAPSAAERRHDPPARREPPHHRDRYRPQVRPIIVVPPEYVERALATPKPIKRKPSPKPSSSLEVFGVYKN